MIGIMLAVAMQYSANVETAEQRAELTEELWRHDPSAEIVLWPKDKVPLRANDKPLRKTESELRYRNLVVTDVNDPFMTFFPAAGEGAKPTVVVLPGGGYQVLGWNKEGTEVAAWLNELGFSAAVLLYRVPEQRVAALCDAQRAVGLLRHRAKELRVDPRRIGVIGFSAGANLAVTLATNWRARRYEKVDAADDCPCRPDFVMPIYPWDLRPRNDVTTPWKGCHGWTLRAEYPVDAETPPSFTVQSVDDFCGAETAAAWDGALRAVGVKSVAKIYPNGGHGYGLRQLDKSTDAWPFEAVAWLVQFRAP